MIYKITCTEFKQFPFTRDAVDYSFKLMIVKHVTSYTHPKRVVVKVGVTGPLQAVWYHRGLRSEDLHRVAFKKALDFIIEKIEESDNLLDEYTIDLNSKNTPVIPPEIDEIPANLKKTYELVYDF